MAIREEDMDNYRLVQKRLSLFMGSRIIRRKKIKVALALQDELRKKHSNIDARITGTDQIRKQRDTRR